MANIVPSDAAPNEKVHYTFASVEFDLGPSEAYASEDDSLLSSAAGHPWLEVEVDENVVPIPTFSDQLDPKDDHLSAQGGIDANDPELARQAEEDKARAAGRLTDEAEPAPGPDFSEEVTHGPDPDEDVVAVPSEPLFLDDPNTGEI